MSSPTTVKLWVDPDGTIRFVHDDDVHASLVGAGRPETVRAGYVEPAADGWGVELVGGLGGHAAGPFTSRAAALAAERDMVDTALDSGLRPRSCQ